MIWGLWNRQKVEILRMCEISILIWLTTKGVVSVISKVVSQMRIEISHFWQRFVSLRSRCARNIFSLLKFSPTNEIFFPPSAGFWCVDIEIFQQKPVCEYWIVSKIPVCGDWIFQTNPGVWRLKSSETFPLCRHWNFQENPAVWRLKVSEKFPLSTLKISGKSRSVKIENFRKTPPVSTLKFSGKTRSVKIKNFRKFPPVSTLKSSGKSRSVKIENFRKTPLCRR